MATINMNPSLVPQQHSTREEPVGDSSFIQKIKYDSAQSCLTVTMKNGSEYQHFGVEAGTVDKFMLSPSKGAFYGKFIKGKGVTTRTISKNTGPAERNPARGPVESRRVHGRQRTNS